ncbi:hypothetical protein HDU96_007348 [Phlyctochytrium bullatum]|nr:hypothetical protein HDU96_007348 [Phlyctochytrium bullatum]
MDNAVEVLLLAAQISDRSSEINDQEWIEAAGAMTPRLETVALPNSLVSGRVPRKIKQVYDFAQVCKAIKDDEREKKNIRMSEDRKRKEDEAKKVLDAKVLSFEIHAEAVLERLTDLKNIGALKSAPVGTDSVSEALGALDENTSGGIATPMENELHKSVMRGRSRTYKYLRSALTNPLDSGDVTIVVDDDEGDRDGDSEQETFIDADLALSDGDGSDEEYNGVDLSDEPEDDALALGVDEPESILDAMNDDEPEPIGDAMNVDERLRSTSASETPDSSLPLFSLDGFRSTLKEKAPLLTTVLDALIHPSRDLGKTTIAGLLCSLTASSKNRIHSFPATLGLILYLEGVSAQACQVLNRMGLICGRKRVLKTLNQVETAVRSCIPSFLSRRFVAVMDNCDISTHRFERSQGHNSTSVANYTMTAVAPVTFLPGHLDDKKGRISIYRLSDQHILPSVEDRKRCFDDLKIEIWNACVSVLLQNERWKSLINLDEKNTLKLREQLLLKHVHPDRPHDKVRLLPLGLLNENEMTLDGSMNALTAISKMLRWDGNGILPVIGDVGTHKVAISAKEIREDDLGKAVDTLRHIHMLPGELHYGMNFIDVILKLFWEATSSITDERGSIRDYCAKYKKFYTCDQIQYQQRIQVLEEMWHVYVSTFIELDIPDIITSYANPLCSDQDELKLNASKSILGTIVDTVMNKLIAARIETELEPSKKVEGMEHMIRVIKDHIGSDGANRNFSHMRKVSIAAFLGREKLRELFDQCGFKAANDHHQSIDTRQDVIDFKAETMKQLISDSKAFTCSDLSLTRSEEELQKRDGDIWQVIDAEREKMEFIKMRSGEA